MTNRPTIEQVRQYKALTGSPVDAERFWMHYEHMSPPWQSKGKPIYRWQALFDCWGKYHREQPPATPGQVAAPPSSPPPTQREPVVVAAPPPPPPSWMLVPDDGERFTYDASGNRVYLADDLPADAPPSPVDDAADLAESRRLAASLLASWQSAEAAPGPYNPPPSARPSLAYLEKVYRRDEVPPSAWDELEAAGRLV